MLAYSLMETAVAGLIEAEHYERTGERGGYRNVYRMRGTRVGTMLAIPKIRLELPSLLEPRRRAERGLLGVGQEAYVHGVSTRKVDEPDSPPIAGAPCHDQTRRRNVRAKVPLGDLIFWLRPSRPNAQEALQ